MRRTLRAHADSCRAREHLCRGQAKAALPLTVALLALEPKEPEWRILHALALLGTGHPADALQQAEATRRMALARDLAGENAYAGALAAARLHDAARDGEDRRRLFLRVLGWVEEAAEADPRLLREMGQQAELEPFLDALKPRVP
ncbi:MAG: hypothetical protein LC623_04910 [Halobacteriales archaeon]|nr:hypothetical protein [Halobacteriales archaeon]